MIVASQPITGRPTWAEIDLDSLASNFNTIKRLVGPDVAVMAVVKANAYGHGAFDCAKRLEREGAAWFGVALPEEGIALRNSGIGGSVLCLGGVWPGQTSACIQHQLVPVVYRLDIAEALDRAARDAGTRLNVHVKVDTGMGRLGVRFDELNSFLGQLQRFEHVSVDGLMTHFAAADEASCAPLTEQQLERFDAALRMFNEHGFHPTYRHLANSAAIYSQPRAFGNIVRPGGVLYGLWRDVLPLNADGKEIRAVMTLKTRITLLKWVPPGETIGYGCTFEASRRSLIATLPVGYDDGYMRGLSNRGHVLIRGVFAPVVGRISMDLTLVDVTNVPGVSLDDEITLFGVSGDLKIPVEELARIVGTLSYEVTCGVGERVPRVFITR
ncbi:MAG TPA: alanine racemase [Pyrinomonadaceae bacterium]|nr:alanine racemase [Pyrinomonadaceae bacterium]